MDDVKGHTRKTARSSAQPSPMTIAITENESLLRKYLWRFTSSFHDVEDISQETIYRALKADKTTEIEEPKAFLFGIARNVVRKRLEKKSRSVIDFIEDYEPLNYISDEPLQDEKCEQRERMREFAGAVATLPAQCQKVFVLKKVYGYSHKEISKKLGISISTTEKHVAAGLKRCLQHIDNQGLNESETKIVQVLNVSIKLKE